MQTQPIPQTSNLSPQTSHLLFLTSSLPPSPGCYLFKNNTGTVLYVGKAKNLKKRLAQYFGQDKRPQLPFLITEASNLDYIVASSELEALMLENTLIKKHKPKYNIRLKDDKNYAFICIDYTTPIPQIGYVRKTGEVNAAAFQNPAAHWGSEKHSRHSRGIRKLVSPTARKSEYFGPYSSAKKIRDTLDLVRRIFPYCANTEISKRPCFYYHLHRCPGVCIGKISLAEYSDNLARIKMFLRGQTRQVKRELESEMRTASQRRQFERAARLRDQWQALRLLDEKQIAQFPKPINADILAATSDGSLTCINLFKIRSGKLTDKENFIYDNPPHSQTHQLLPAVLQIFAENYYSDTSDLPAHIFLEQSLTDDKLIVTLLRQRAGKKINLTVPRRGKAKKLIALGQLNAAEYLRQAAASNATNRDHLAAALEELRLVLHLPAIPRRIECYDISNTQGTNPVASMVVFQDGLPAKSQYRKFKIRSKNTPDDFTMMRETLVRRLARMKGGQWPMANGQTEADSPLNTQHSTLSSWPRPDLIVIDGGKGQLGTALEAAKLQMTNDKFQINSSTKIPSSKLNPTPLALSPIPMIGLAKRLEEIFLLNNPKPITLSRDNPALQLLQRLRDEAHRFGITFHRQLRGKQATRSRLDEVPGIGPKTKKLLKNKFGALSNIRAASLAELSTIIGYAKAQLIKQRL